MRLFRLIFFKMCQVSLEFFLENVFYERTDKIYFCGILELPGTQHVEFADYSGWM